MKRISKRGAELLCQGKCPGGMTPVFRLGRETLPLVHIQRGRMGKYDTWSGDGFLREVYISALDIVPTRTLPEPITLSVRFTKMDDWRIFYEASVKKFRWIASGSWIAYGIQEKNPQTPHDAIAQLYQQVKKNAPVWWNLEWVFDTKGN